MISTLEGEGGAARSSGVRFKEHIAITTASTTAVVDHLRCSGYMHLGYQPRLDSCERRGHVPLESGVALEYFVGLQRYTGTLVTSILPSIETFCEVIHKTNHATKCPTPSLDEDSFYSKQFTSSQALKDEVT